VERGGDGVRRGCRRADEEEGMGIRWRVRDEEEGLEERGWRRGDGGEGDGERRGWRKEGNER